MSDAKSRRSVRLRFSLLNLLTLTALIAVGTAINLAYRKNHLMVRQRDDLLSLSSQLKIDNKDELASSEMPSVASDFHSWNVHVPNGQAYELRLGMGAVSENGIPPIVGGVRISAGRHRVTLHAGDSPGEEFRYVVYVDGKQAIDKKMGSDWMPGGWSSASGISWPRQPNLSPAPLQLFSRSYTPRYDFGKGHHFNGQSDDYLTRMGYRLWIDHQDRTYPPTSPFVGFGHYPGYQGIGLRDGLRYRQSNRPPYEWTFTRPNLETNDPVLRVAAEFFFSDGTTLSSQTQSFQSWQLRNDASGESSLNWQVDPKQSVYSAFLQANHKSADVPQPVVEMKWDAGRPDEVGLRIAATPANDRISRWRLRILDGTKHLWRELQIGDRRIDADEAIDKSVTKTSDATVTLDLGQNVTEDIHLQWQTDETLPLQILERRQKRYAGMGLYEGLPLTLGIQIPSALKPTLTVNVVKEIPNALGNPLPGGAIFDEIQMDLEAVGDAWIWLQVKSKK
ncbi:MAG: hypothetical protein H6822_32850 [Planctomycetaceae bacterium]|nr:hypothetical protein [Planctomycetaceae bacterium]